MSLKLNSLNLTNFRTYKNTHIENLNNICIFYGKNGVGKSNLIESIQLISSLNSFKTSKSEECIKSGYTLAKVDAEITDGNRELFIGLDIQENRKKYTLNKKNKKMSELKGVMPSVIFTPDDLEIIKGSPNKRRKEFDLLGEQLSKSYYKVLKDYNQILKQKNSLLKEGVNKEVLISVNDVFLTIGAQLSYYRYVLFMRLLPQIKEYYKKISIDQELLTGSYSVSFFNSEINKELNTQTNNYEFLKSDFINAAKKAIVDNIEREVSAKRSLVGPHLDSISFYLNNQNANLFASQGQARSISLAIKLAEASYIEESLNQKPLILLDDVMSELDLERRQSLVLSIRDKGQIFISCVDLDCLDRGSLTNTSVYKVEKNLGVSSLKREN
jgi:DNA replication and repair protein RecF